MQKFHLFIFIIVVLIAQACTVSLINTGIDYSVLDSFSLEQFEVKSSNAPPTSGQTFSEQLKDRILNNTRLKYVDEDGDVQFSGNVVGYQISSLAPQANQTVAFQRLTIEIAINYKDTKQKDGSKNWTQTFSRFANFAADTDLSTVEDALIQEIYDQVLDDVFNRAFSGW
ncbi:MULTISPECIES: LPS assembly lipoprotein LptE [unclassified Aureispira]|uniref:LPS assembly lipoprotein LptE n=1 Tax=unclassified Aureispira TaxID=2649989 RepID=UPI0006973F7B|nr:MULTISPECIES: LPS assembly lipoprotein LptE [unclassified Aureispira]WMX12517.1 LPS assembly lipoprotein LptE [Aureispira sp. CCB-E]